MAQIQWIRHINRLCEIRGNKIHHGILFNSIVHFYNFGECTDKQGNWIVYNLKGKLPPGFSHSGIIQLSVSQRREVREAVEMALGLADHDRLSFLCTKFTHISHTSLAVFAQRSRIKISEMPAKS